ncbi:hypothetical protein V1512DRAFT_267061 [Lipomyces arxii]|uniref:uncharacterized protein n=1 Tax=Lipomyces arxii TaxID=56418 RepID=UPI0034CE7010
MAKRRHSPDEAGRSVKSAPNLADAEEIDEQQLLEADVPGSGPKQARRNKLKEVQGYRSDSSEDDFFTSARTARKVADEEDQDMFDVSDAKPTQHETEQDDDGSSDEDDVDGVSKKSRKVRFLDITEIEGQDLSRPDEDDEVDAEQVNREVEKFTAAHVQIDMPVPIQSEKEENDVDDLPEDIDPEIGLTGSRLHAPKLEAFNMRADLEEGSFDQNGNFVRKSDAENDAQELHDIWLDGISSRNIRAAAKADEIRRKREREAEIAADKDQHDRPAQILFETLLHELQPTETPLEALQRLGPGKKKNKWLQKKKKIVIESEEDLEKEQVRKTSVEAITDAADKLMSRGSPDIYETPRELILRMYNKANT